MINFITYICIFWKTHSLLLLTHLWLHLSLSSCAFLLSSVIRTFVDSEKRLTAVRNDEWALESFRFCERVAATAAHLQNDLFYVPWLYFLRERHNINMPVKLVGVFFTKQPATGKHCILTRKILQNFQLSALLQPSIVDFSMPIYVLLGTFAFTQADNKSRQCTCCFAKHFHTLS